MRPEVCSIHCTCNGPVACKSMPKIVLMSVISLTFTELLWPLLLLDNAIKYSVHETWKHLSNRRVRTPIFYCVKLDFLQEGNIKQHFEEIRY
jgi:hypothetical protein